MYRMRFDSGRAFLYLAVVLAAAFLIMEIGHLIPLKPYAVYGDPTGLQISVPDSCAPGEVVWAWLHDERTIQTATGKIVETNTPLNFATCSVERHYCGAQFACPLNPGKYTVFAQTDKASITAPLPVVAPGGNSTGGTNNTSGGNKTGGTNNTNQTSGGTQTGTATAGTSIMSWLFNSDPSIYLSLKEAGLPDGLAQLLSMPITWVFLFLILVLLVRGSRYTGYSSTGYRARWIR